MKFQSPGKGKMSGFFSKKVHHTDNKVSLLNNGSEGIVAEDEILKEQNDF